MAIYLKCIPEYYLASIFEIPYEKLKKQGKNALLFDLDNTIIDYHESILSQETIEFLKKLEKDFKIIIISNSGKKRVSKAVGEHFDYVYHATKPLKRGFKKAIKKIQLPVDQIVMIGDQLMTDIFGANRMGMTTVLVDAVARKTDRFYTRLNRRIEKHYLNKIKKKAPEKYEKVLKAYADKNS